MFQEYVRQTSTFDTRRKERSSDLQTTEADERIYRFFQRNSVVRIFLGAVPVNFP